MSKKADPNRALHARVFAEMTNRGILNYVSACGVSLAASAIIDSDQDGLKPYKDFPVDLNNQIAMELVFDYLSRQSLSETLTTIAKETDGRFPAGLSSIAENELGITDQQPCAALTADWLRNGDRIRRANDDALLREVHEGIADVKVRVARKHVHTQERPRASTLEPPSRFLQAAAVSPRSSVPLGGEAPPRRRKRSGSQKSAQPEEP
jgi:hypothetical protein